jgi:hypothetical protein
MRRREIPIKRFRQMIDMPGSKRSGQRDSFDDPRWQLAQRIAASRSIGRSPLLSDFLLYVCDRQLRDKTSEVTEQRIGVHVFGRDEGYNSNDDNIVRNYARTLRKRVDEYFETEGWHEDIRLEIPRGGYIPVFSPRLPERALLQHGNETPASTAIAPAIETPAVIEPDSAAKIEDAVAELHPEPQPSNTAIETKSSQRWVALACAAVLVIACCVACVLVWRKSLDSRVATTSGDQGSILWRQLFQKDRDTFIVPADSGLVILQGLTQHPVSLNEYASGSYRAVAASPEGLSARDVNELGIRRYTSIVDLNLAAHIARLSEVVPERMLVRYARDLRMDDLRSSNAILFGSVDSNPWDTLFEQQLNFRFLFSPKHDTSPTIINQHPRPGEQAVYANHNIGDAYSTFGIVSFLPNLDNTGHVLMIAGLNMAGTQAAGDFVMNPDLMKPTLEHARGPNGTLRPFEILIETDSVAANASRPHVVSERIGPS